MHIGGANPNKPQHFTILAHAKTQRRKDAKAKQMFFAFLAALREIRELLNLDSPPIFPTTISHIDGHTGEITGYAGDKIIPVILEALWWTEYDGN